MKVQFPICVMLGGCLALSLLTACQPGSPAMDAAATAAPTIRAASAEPTAESAANDAAASADDLPEAASEQDDRQVPPAWSNAQGNRQNGASSSNRCQSGKPHPQIGKLAVEFQVDEALIADYLCQSGLNPGTLRTAFRIAEQSETDVDTVLALRAEGFGWGQIRARLGVADDDTILDDNQADEDDEPDDD
jgi:hypothetical protein